MKIGLKFCGGCNPAYDRLRLAGRLQERFGDRVEWVSPESREADLIVVIAGCPVSCVELPPLKDRPLFLIAAEKDLESLIEKIATASCGESSILKRQEP